MPRLLPENVGNLPVPHTLTLTGRVARERSVRPLRGASPGLLDRTLSDAEWREAETHLSDCDYCRRRYRFEETLRRYVRTSSMERMPPGLIWIVAELRGLDATA